MTTRVGIDVPDVGYRPTLGESIRRAAREFGDADFIVLPDRRMTFEEAESRSRQVAKRMLAAGLGKGTRVGLAFTYGPEFVVAWLAALRIGALVMPFSTIYKPAELRQVLRIGDVHTLIAPSTLLGRDFHGYLEAAIPGLADSGRSPAFLPEVPYLRAVWIDGDSDRPWATPVSLDGSDVVTEVPDEVLARVEDEVVPADLAQVVYTSGSSALPKGVVHSHAAIVRTTAEFGDLLRNSSTTPVLCAFPFFWIGGTLVLGAALHGGIALCCLERFEPEAALDLVEKERAKSVAAWPSLIQSMKSHPSFAGRDLSSCPMLVEGPSDVALLGSPVPGIPRHRGMSETVGNWNGVARRVVDPETGADVPDMQEGELLIRGHGLMLGYYKKEREEVFDADGWLHTGDRVFMHENQPWFVGRYYEMIKSQGANVSPREVELMLEGLPGVQHALVMAFPHPEMEEEVGVVIVPAPGTTVDPVELEKLARAELSSYKVPTRWIIIDDESQIPWLASGKPDKLQLRRMLVDEAP